MDALAIVVFLVAYALIATERVHRTAVALAGAGLMLLAKILTADEAFRTTEFGIDWNVIFLLLGMMLIVEVIRRTGLFEFLAIWSAKRARGQPYRILVILCVLTAVASALLDNVTTVLLVAPATVVIAQRLGLRPAPFLVAEAMASNIGGAATLVGDPPNIIIGSAADLSYVQFATNLAPVALIVLVLFLGLARVLFRPDLQAHPDRIAEVMALDERRAITNPSLLFRSLLILAAVTVGFVLHKPLGYEPSSIAIVGAAALVLTSGQEVGHLLNELEWETLVFFMGLFVMVGALVKVGAIQRLAEWAAATTKGNLLAGTMLILVVSGVLSGLVDNVPYVAAMAPLVRILGVDIGAGSAGVVLWWSLALGADLGGNATAVGAAANVVIVSVARRADDPISFSYFLKYGAIVTSLSLAVSALYLWVRYFLL
jgi:Na+/H+ antiporter NhaD/arsenite permease-like protein